MASMDARTRHLLDVEAELLDELGSFAGGHRAPTVCQDCECRRISIGRNS
jgi:hypothetical protein